MLKKTKTSKLFEQIMNFGISPKQQKLFEQQIEELYTDEQQKQTELTKLKELVAIFNKKTNAIPVEKRDSNYWLKQGYENFRDFVGTELMKTKSGEKKSKKSGLDSRITSGGGAVRVGDGYSWTDPTGNTHNYDVWVVFTHNGSYDIAGKGGAIRHWCISTPNVSFWDDYTANGSRFVFLIDNDEKPDNGAKEETKTPYVHLALEHNIKNKYDKVWNYYDKSHEQTAENMSKEDVKNLVEYLKKNEWLPTWKNETEKNEFITEIYDQYIAKNDDGSISFRGEVSDFATLKYITENKVSDFTGDIYFVGNDKLTDISLDIQSFFGDIYIVDCINFTGFEKCPKELIGSLYLQHNPKLKTLQNAPQKISGNVFVSYSPALKDVGSIEVIKGEVRAIDCPSSFVSQLESKKA